MQNGPDLKDFIVGGQSGLDANALATSDLIPYVNESDYNGRGRKVFLEVYGCQMNVNDTEIVWSILKSKDYVKVASSEEADVVLLMTCSIREKAESKVSATVPVQLLSTHNCVRTAYANDRMHWMSF